MRNKISAIRHLLVAMLATGALWSCTGDLPDGPRESVSWNEDGSMNVTIGIDIPGMNEATRALGSEPNYADLNLYVLVFDEETGNILQSQKVTSAKTENTGHAGSPLMEFSAVFYATDNYATVHLVATNQENVSDQIGLIGNENQLRSITTTDGMEAYWARIPLGVRILSAEDAGHEENAAAIAEKLNHVVMLRNFGKITVEVAQNVGFVVDEMYLYNYADRGSVAPYLIVSTEDEATTAANGFVQFFTESGSGANKTLTPRDYRYISGTIGHIGEPPAGTTIKRGEIEKITSSTENGSPVLFFYERPFRSEDRLFVVLRGRRNGGAPSYYKVDMGKQDEQSDFGEFVYYNMLRNFDYHIIINEVTAEGYPSAEEAMNGMVYNNISASVETRSLLTISEGSQTISVNKTSHVFTMNTYQSGLFELQGYYRNGTANESAQLKLMVKDDPDGIIDIKSETAVQVNGEAWRQWNIGIKTGVTPTNVAKQATLVVYRGKVGDSSFGLYRTITVTLINYYTIQKIDTYPGLWESFDDAPWEWPEDHVTREVGQGVDAPLTLFFQLPQGLPEAIFPLEFTIESDRQNIQNAYQGNAAVKTVPPSQSLFWNSGPEVSTARIQFVKNVTWQEYTSVEEGQNFVVRCRFLTITDLAQDGIGNTQGGQSSSKTTLRVANAYFNMNYDEFERNTATSDPSPRFIDFSSTEWSAILTDLNSETRTRYQNILLFDGLYLTEAAARTVTSGNADGVSYIRFSNNNDAFSYPLTYSGDHVRELRIEVMSANDAGAPAAPLVTAGNLTLTTETLDDTEPFKTYVYTARINNRNQAVTADITIKRPAGTVMRFYRINIYPQYEQF